jgi:hypothetical protein
VQADEALPSHGELDLDELRDNVNSNPDGLEMDGPMAYDYPAVPHVLRPCNTWKSMNIFCEATQMSQST